MDQLSCSTCGHPLGPGDLFCTACGARASSGDDTVVRRPRPTGPTGPAGPAGPVAPSPAAPAAAAPPQARPPRRRRSTARFWGWVAAAALVVGAASYALGTLSEGHDHRRVAAGAGAGSGSVGGPGGSPTATAGSPAPTGDPQAVAQARALHTLIAHSATDKQRIAAAAAQLQSCHHIEQAIQTFQDAAASRDRLVDQAAELEVGLLPGGGAAVATFRQAERAAADADRAYVVFGQARHTASLKVRNRLREQAARADEHAGKHPGKHGGKHPEPPTHRDVCRGAEAQLRQAVRLSSASHAPKQATAQAWNVIAAQFDLPRVTWTSL